MVARGQRLGVEEMGVGDQKGQLSSYKTSHQEVMYSMVSLVTNTVLFIWKFLRKYIFKVTT